MVSILQVTDFIKSVHSSYSLYGLQQETMDSLILDILPPHNHTYTKVDENNLPNTKQPATTYLLQELLVALCSHAGFRIPKVGNMI